MSEAVETLSRYENRPVAQLFTDLLHFNSDVIRFRVDYPRTKFGMIPVNTGPTYYAGIKRVLETSICDVQSPKRYHNRVVTGDTKKLVDMCSFGPSEEGSYIASLLCPVFQDPPVFFLPASVPESSPIRDVTWQMMNALTHIAQALQRHEEERLVSPNTERGDPIISGNFYEATALLEPDDEGTLEVAVSWSETLSRKPSLPRNCRFTKSEFSLLKDVAATFRPSEDSTFESLVGKVIELSGEEGDLGLPFGTVTLRVLSRAFNGPVNAVVDLDRDDYEIACDAHKMGASILIKGELGRRHGHHYISEYS